MPDVPSASVHPVASARDVDGECRGIGRAAPWGVARSDGSPGRASRPNAPVDVPVAVPVVRDADRMAVRDAAARAATQDARDRVGRTAGLPACDDAERQAAPSPELTGALEHLQTALARYVAARRDAGVPVERVLPEVKALVREAAGCEGWYDPAETLVAHVVRCTIAAYYEEREGSRVPDAR